MTDRELDALVAEHVMGARISDRMPHYSTDLVAAFRAAQKVLSGMILMQSDTGQWAVASSSTGPVQNGKANPEWHTAMFEPDDWQETPELAICHAALRACGIEVRR